MIFMFDSASGKKNRPVNWKLFVFFLILCFIFIFLLIYFLLPGFFSGPIIERIPIIIEDLTDEVRGFVWRLI